MKFCFRYIKSRDSELGRLPVALPVNPRTETAVSLTRCLSCSVCKDVSCFWAVAAAQASVQNFTIDLLELEDQPVLKGEKW